MHILVVDDDQAVRDSLARSLHYSGWEVTTASDGIDALARLSGLRPDAVIMDVMMPRLDGLETTRSLRASGNDVPILVLTARDAVGDLSLIHICAADRRGGRRPGGQGAVHHRLGIRVAGEPSEQRRDLPVDAGVGVGAGRQQARRHTEGEAGERDRIDAEVEQRAAGQSRVVESWRPVAVEALAVVGDDRLEVAEHAVGEELARCV